jgi:hypothetical protein
MAPQIPEHYAMTPKKFTDTQATRNRKMLQQAQAERDGRMIGNIIVLVEVVVFALITYCRATHG